MRLDLNSQEAVFAHLSTSDMNADGLVVVGGELSSQTLLAAYRHGIFPWPADSQTLLWYCPPERAILRKLHISRSLMKALKSTTFNFTWNQAFHEVILRCASVSRKNQAGTWITPAMLEAYLKLHQEGYAHSVEVWEKQSLVGGLYGVEIDGCFSGESMFHQRSNASKMAVIFLYEHLKKQGIEWIDIQIMTPHMKAMGAELISRSAYLDLLIKTQSRKLPKICF